VIRRISLRQALADPALLGGVLEGESWKPWRTLLIAAMGEDLTQDERRRSSRCVRASMSWERTGLARNEARQHDASILSQKAVGVTSAGPGFVIDLGLFPARMSI
jgi:hypothetical protein